MKKNAKFYTTKGNIKIKKKSQTLEKGEEDINNILRNLNHYRGVYLSSTYEYPGRYSRWEFAFDRPPLEVKSQNKNFFINALNKRGEILLKPIFEKISGSEMFSNINFGAKSITGSIKSSDKIFREEERSRQPSVFSLIREIEELFFSKEDSLLGLYGAFGYDLVFQFEPMQLKQQRKEDQFDLVLYLPDSIIEIDHKLERVTRVEYDFLVDNISTELIERDGEYIEIENDVGKVNAPETVKGAYANIVRKAKKTFKAGDLFESVPGHIIYKETELRPSEIFDNMRAINPSPYGFIINLGGEHLIGCSPEMYVRVTGRRVETCPISGTIKRGKNAIEDSEQIKALLNSKKDESELTMCTDVDRNDKSRICVPGSVKVIGRRQLEMYSHLIHTVDHVEGYLRDEFDSLDAFMTHMWAVTVTGAPKRWAIKWLEENEDSCREWYGGAVGVIRFNGDINTGLTLRTLKLKNHIAAIRVGATLLYDSVPEEEEEETYTKAAALIKSLKEKIQNNDPKNKVTERKSFSNLNVLFVDHEDSFVHTLADYFRQFGAKITTLRYNYAQKQLERGTEYDLVVLSPGPGRPGDFNLNLTIDLCINNNIPIFGICLGLQGLVEYFGGKLGILDYPQHGKKEKVTVTLDSIVYKGIPKEFNVGRYHSLYGMEVPECLNVTSKSSDGVVMSIEHKNLNIVAVQYHPESILTLENDTGFKIIENVLENVEKIKMKN